MLYSTVHCDFTLDRSGGEPYFKRRALEIPSRSLSRRRVNTNSPKSNGGIGGISTAANLYRLWIS